LLQPWFKLATEKKGNFFFKNGLLFHREQELGHNVEQLVLPSSRIPSVLELAHDATFSGHYAYKNTLRRVRLAFCFPQMKQKIKEYCDTCHDCQLRARELVKDRTPITAIPRNEVPFHIFGGTALVLCLILLFAEVNLILCSTVTCYCDHNPLLYITQGVTSSAKLLRWSLALQKYDVSFKYRLGRQNLVADCLSRLCDWSSCCCAARVDVCLT